MGSRKPLIEIKSREFWASLKKISRRIFLAGNLASVNFQTLFSRPPAEKTLLLDPSRTETEHRPNWGREEKRFSLLFFGKREHVESPNCCQRIFLCSWFRRKKEVSSLSFPDLNLLFLFSFFFLGKMSVFRPKKPTTEWATAWKTNYEGNYRYFFPSDDGNREIKSRLSSPQFTFRSGNWKEPKQKTPSLVCFLTTAAGVLEDSHSLAPKPKKKNCLPNGRDH